MTIKRMATRFAAILLTIYILLSVPVIFPGETVHALDYTLLESKLSTWQQYICRTMMSISLAKIAMIAKPITTYGRTVSTCSQPFAEKLPSVQK